MLLAASVLAVVDGLLALPGLRALLATGLVLALAAATLLSAAAAEQPGVLNPRAWQTQAVASGLLMFAAMASVSGPTVSVQPVCWLLASAAAVLFVVSAAMRVERARWGARALRLVLDSGVVALAAGLLGVGVFRSELAQAGLLVAPALFVGAAYAVLFATRGASRVAPHGPEAALLAGVGLLAISLGGYAASQLGVLALSVFASPALALIGALLLAWSAFSRPRLQGPRPVLEAADDSRLRLVPPMAAVSAIAFHSALELSGSGSRLSLVGVVGLFGLVVARLVLAQIENRQLLRRVERSGVFEEKLRDLGVALMAALEREEALELVCRAAHVSFGADAVLLWIVDPATEEIEVVEVYGAKRSSVLERRVPLADQTTLAARVARTGESEIVSHVPTAGLSNPFLNVLLKAQCLLAVPIARGDAVLGVLVCVDSRRPDAYGAQELAKAELLASQVAVAVDNANQRDQQRRRLEEVTALYRFAQSAHTAISAPQIAQQLLPILKDRVRYTYVSVWLRDPAVGTLRLASGDSPGGVPLAGARPSELASCAFSTGRPVHAGLGWAVGEEAYVPPRSGIRSQLAVPMVLKDRVVGVVDLESKQANAYSLNDERLLVSIANHAALAVDNLHLVEEARKVQTFKELDRMKSDLLSTVSHELRTPLGSIKGYASMLLLHDSKLGGAERREYIETIDSEADRLRELIENLLDLSRLEAGVLRVEPKPVLLGATAREVVRKVQLATRLHQVVLDWPEERELIADPKRVYQVMQNLLSNAVKYSPDGGRIVLRGEFQPRQLVVSVVDQGLGMPPNELDRIFDRFHRVAGGAAAQIGGTGLGLAICKAFVDAHGGRIWAESDGVDKGSSFRFTLPLVAATG